MAYLQQIRTLFLSLSMRQRILLGVAAVVVFGLIAGLNHWQHERNFKPLFTELSGEDAGTVLARLKESGVEVRLEDGGKTIKVPADRIDEIRIQMASAGLPKSGRIGFELFDKTNFGTSEFAEQVNYHRAVEGELERSVMSLHEVESARVHITFPRQSLFLENRQPAKASVLLKLKPSAVLSKQNIQAVAHLTASAVDGLTPENVSILDMRGNLLSKPSRDADQDEETSKQLLEYRERLERDTREKIRLTLEPLLGADGFRTAVSIDCDLASGDQSEETFDPSKSVMATNQHSEDGAAAASANGVPGTASNLPRPTSRPGMGANGPIFRRSESTTFQTSRVVRHIKFPRGQVKRMSVSVLLDYTIRNVGGKTTAEPPPPERVRAIKEIVSGTVGFQQDRGDQVIVESLPFDAMRAAQPEPAAAPAPNSGPRVPLPHFIPEWLRIPFEGHLSWLVAQSWLPGIVVLLVLIVAFFVFRVLRAISRKTRFVAGKALEAAAGRLPFPKKIGQNVDITLDASLEGVPSHAQLTAPGEGGAVMKTFDEQIRERDQLQERLTQDALLHLEIPKAEVRKAEVLTRHLSEMCEKDPSAVANLLRSWIEAQ